MSARKAGAKKSHTHAPLFNLNAFLSEMELTSESLPWIFWLWEHENQIESLYVVLIWLANLESNSKQKFRTWVRITRSEALDAACLSSTCGELHAKPAAQPPLSSTHPTAPLRPLSLLLSFRCVLSFLSNMFN